MSTVRAFLSVQGSDERLDRRPVATLKKKKKKVMLVITAADSTPVRSPEGLGIKTDWPTSVGSTICVKLYPCGGSVREG